VIIVAILAKGHCYHWKEALHLCCRIPPTNLTESFRGVAALPVVDYYHNQSKEWNNQESDTDVCH